MPRDGWQLLTADYSQVELRLLAHFSGDEALRKAFADDEDIQRGRTLHQGGDALGDVVLPQQIEMLAGR